MTGRFIAIAGNIGVGKTSLVEFLTHQYQCAPVYEPFQANPYLEDFYEDMTRWAFHSQVAFLSHKFRLHQELSALPGSIVQDRTIYEDAEIFATNLARSGKMSERDYRTYQDLYTAMQTVLRPPDLLIYLRCSVPTLQRRIRRRGRPSELGIPVPYLRALNTLYEEWVGRYRLSPVLVWDAEGDYMTNLVDRMALEKMLEGFLERQPR